MINQDFNALGSFDHDPEIGGDHEPTATNTPTPELERYEPNKYKNSVFSMARHKDGDYVLHSEAAAAIAKLTAERDKWRDAWMKSAHDEAEAIRERDEAIERGEAAEKRVKELEAHIEELQEKNAAETCACSYDNAGDVCMGHSPALAASETANKLLSERVAVLETALEPFARYATDPFDKDHKGYPFPDGQGVGWVYLTHADFRLALAALEAK